MEQTKQERLRKMKEQAKKEDPALYEAMCVLDKMDKETLYKAITFLKATIADRKEEQETEPPEPENIEELRKLTTHLYLPLWEKWIEERLENGCEEEVAIRRIFAKLQGIGDSTPYALMFMGFVVGIDTGIEIAEKLNENDKDRNEDD